MVSYNALSLAEVLQHQYPLHLCVYCRNVDTICMKQTYFHCVSMVCRDTPTNMFFSVTGLNPEPKILLHFSLLYDFHLKLTFSVSKGQHILYMQ